MHFLADVLALFSTASDLVVTGREPWHAWDWCEAGQRKALHVRITRKNARLEAVKYPGRAVVETLAMNEPFCRHCLRDHVVHGDEHSCHRRLETALRMGCGECVPRIYLHDFVL